MEINAKYKKKHTLHDHNISIYEDHDTFSDNKTVQAGRSHIAHVARSGSQWKRFSNTSHVFNSLALIIAIIV